MTFQLVPFSVLEAIGVAGFVTYVTTYTLLTVGILTSRCVTYFCLNLLASSMVLLGLMASFNLASAMIQVFFMTMSGIGIILRLMPRKLV